MEAHGYVRLDILKRDYYLIRDNVGDFCEMLRVAVTTLSNTPNLYDILTILGKEEKR